MRCQRSPSTRVSSSSTPSHGLTASLGSSSTMTRSASTSLAQDPIPVATERLPMPSGMTRRERRGETMSEYTAEGFHQDVIDERIDTLLDAWNVDEDDDDFTYRRNSAYELAVAFPSEIATDLFAEYVAEGITSL